VKSSAVFLNTGIWWLTITGSGASSRQGTLVHPAYTLMVLATENRPHAPHGRRLECVEQAEGVGSEVVDRIGQVVGGRREVRDAGDLAPLADVEEGRLVRGVQRLVHDPAAGLVGEVLGQLGGPVRGEDDGLAQGRAVPVRCATRWNPGRR